MTSPHDLAVLDATAQAELVRSGEASPAELVDAAIERIDRVDPRLNAVIHTCFDEAANAARSAELPDGPFRGVPFLLKDIGATQAGLPLWMGSRALHAAGHRSPGDTELGRRFRAAGLVTLGKTNLPELGSAPTTQPLLFGPTANPWDPSRSPAGSSGGSAAAVAAGLVPVAHANDGGGSTRLPASWTGLVGLKPTRGAMPNPDTTSRLVSELVVSRTVRDTAGVLDATAGATAADLFSGPRHEGSYVAALRADPGPLRIGLLTSAGAIEVDPECVQAAVTAAELLEELGHHVEPVDDTVMFGPAARVNGSMWMAGIHRRVQRIGELVGREPTAEEVEPYNWAAAVRGASMTASEWQGSQEAQQEWVLAMSAWLDGIDVLVTPTSGCPPLRTDDLWPSDEAPWRIGRTYGRIGAFTLPFNVTGHPAISLPLHWTADGLPTGSQLVGPMFGEAVLLSLAARLEEARPWADRRPEVSAAA
jgi:amidase